MMRWSSFEDDIAILPDQQNLLAEATLTTDQLGIVRASKAELVEALCQTQMDAAGFYRCLPEVLEKEIRSASSVVLDIQTTALTRFSLPTRVHKSTLIGPQPWTEYRAAHPKAKADARPRIRTMTLGVDGIGTCAFNLDIMSVRDRARLVGVALRGKVVIGFDLCQTLSWLFCETDERPDSIVDLMLLSKQRMPGVFLRPFAWAASPENAIREGSEKVLKKAKGEIKATFENLCYCLRKGTVDCSYQANASWSISELSDGHKRYIENRIVKMSGIYSDFAASATQGIGVSEWLQTIPEYSSFATATVRLAEAHVRGVPFNDGAAQACLEALDVPRVNFAEDPQTTDSDGGAYPNIRAAQGTMLQTYVSAASTDGRLHSLIAFGTATGRTTSRSPALQNLPKGPQGRDLLRAKDGHTILAVDYVGMELRVAAALAARAVSDIQQRIAAGEESWFLDLVRCGRHRKEVCPWPPEVSKKDPDWYRASTIACSQRVLRHKEQPLREALQAGLDPHLITALEFTRRAGQLGFIGSAVAWLAEMNFVQRSELKVQYSKQRQAAKACNFGLLYGLTTVGLHKTGQRDYGLDWTLAEAAAARSSWFELYPEITLWHLWTKYCQTRKLRPEQIVLWDKTTGCLQTPKYKVDLFEISTMSGRPFTVLQDIGQATSYQGQGTGADILVRAISNLPEEVAKMLLFPVHDELVFEVPEDQLIDVQQHVEQVMISAAEAILGAGIPVEVESCSGKAWS